MLKNINLCPYCNLYLEESENYGMDDTGETADMILTCDRCKRHWIATLKRQDFREMPKC